MDQNLPHALMNSDNHEAPPPNPFGEIEEAEDRVAREFKSFKNFKEDSDVPRDHHYVHNMEYLNFGMKLLQKRAYRARMEEERNLLDKHIPSSIFVRAYKSRDDLMRAAFIGPSGSDYEHCLFFFDMYFPVNYPSVPPKLHYRSFGIDLKPNLRPDGRVCLNMQETWHNRLQQVWSSSNKIEKWNPEESNVLHVLHAIHDLISLPFPKPSPWSFDVIAGLGEEHNTRNFVSVCEKMTRVLREPPVGFEYFVKGHFRQRAHPILLKFKENNYDDRIMIDLFIQMFTVFEMNGVYCKHHLDFLKSRKQQITSEEHLDYLKGHKITNEEDDLDSFKKQQSATCFWKSRKHQIGKEEETFGNFRTY